MEIETIAKHLSKDATLPEYITRHIQEGLDLTAGSIHLAYECLDEALYLFACGEREEAEAKIRHAVRIARTLKKRA